MKIAISVENQNGLESQIAQHFGRSPFFALVDLEGQEVTSVDVVPNPFVSGHIHGQVPNFIHDQNVNVMISGGMGRGAANFFEHFGIETATGASGTVQQTLDKYFKGELGKDASCDHHEHGHGHGHHHGHDHGHHHGHGHHD